MVEAQLCIIIMILTHVRKVPKFYKLCKTSKLLCSLMSVAFKPDASFI